jgi:hypothetical protein
MLDIYVVSLSASWINDATLNSLMGRVPARCILLLEDLDAGKDTLVAVLLMRSHQIISFYALYFSRRKIYWNTHGS